MSTTRRFVFDPLRALVWLEEATYEPNMSREHYLAALVGAIEGSVVTAVLHPEWAAMIYQGSLFRNGETVARGLADEIVEAFAILPQEQPLPTR